MNDIDFLPHNGTVDLKNMDPWQIIKESANAVGIIIYDPKPSCKHCHGRGYIGRHAESGEPIPCRCIFPKPEREIGNVTMKPQNRSERRLSKHKK